MDPELARIPSNFQLGRAGQIVAASDRVDANHADRVAALKRFGAVVAGERVSVKSRRGAGWQAGELGAGFASLLAGTPFAVTQKLASTKSPDFGRPTLTVSLAVRAAAGPHRSRAEAATEQRTRGFM